MSNRGQLSTVIQEKAKAFWGREITQTELRLYPYIYTCAINERKIDPAKINVEERQIMTMWREAGHFKGGMADMNMTKEFFDFINDMLWMGYFTYDND
jgi:hypothetical protein